MKWMGASASPKKSYSFIYGPCPGSNTTVCWENGSISFVPPYRYRTSSLVRSDAPTPQSDLTGLRPYVMALVVSHDGSYTVFQSDLLASQIWNQTD